MLLDSLTLKNLLSFKDATVELRPLNILIGENGAGKSNLIEAVGLLQSLPSDFRSAILRGGGAHFWIWLGAKSPVATLSCQMSGVTYTLDFSDAAGLRIVDERLTEGDLVHYDRSAQTNSFAGPTEALFSFLRNPQDPTPITRIGRQLESIYREFQTGIHSGSRQGVPASIPGDRLTDGGDNLAVVLQELVFREAHETVRKYLNRFSERMTDVRVRLDGGVARAYLREQGLLEPLPSVRMSDGTLKFLCILALLLHPDPPPLVCIEEPEQGLHPDAIQIVAQALREASDRMQLIVTTHSEAMIDALSDAPEDVLVCERDAAGGTQCRRLSAEQLDHWLRRYSLGELWRKGEIGGNRW